MKIKVNIKEELNYGEYKKYRLNIIEQEQLNTLVLAFLAKNFEERETLIKSL